MTIHRIELLAYDWPRLELVIECSGGTYIRSIARDMGEQLGCGGLLEALVRTRIGTFSIDDALDPRELIPTRVASELLPATAALGAMPRISLTDDQVDAIAHGKAVEVDPTDVAEVLAGEVALLAPDGALVAIAERVPQTGRLCPRRVLMARH